MEILAKWFLSDALTFIRQNILLILIIGVPFLVKWGVKAYKRFTGADEQAEWEKMREELNIKEPTPGT